MTRKVTAMPTKPNGNQTWRCDFCGAELTYGQPIALDKQLTILKAFIDEHNHLEEKPQAAQ